MRKFILEHYEAKIRKLFGNKPEVCKFLLSHERKSVLIENLNTELNKLEFSTIRLDSKLLQSVVDDFTLMFARAAILNKEQEIMSYNEKMLQEREYQAQQDLTKELEKTCDESTTFVDSFDSDTK